LDSLHYTLRAPHRRLLQRPIEATVGQVMHVATSVSVAPPVPPRKLDVDLPGSSGIASDLGGGAARRIHLKDAGGAQTKTGAQTRRWVWARDPINPLKTFGPNVKERRGPEEEKHVQPSSTPSLYPFFSVHQVTRACHIITWSTCTSG
jgi:hypothetical protein